MDLAALIISIASMLIAGWSLLYARRSTVASEGVSRRDADRHHQEITPALIGELKVGTPADCIALTLRTPWPLRGITLTIRDGFGITFADGALTAEWTGQLGEDEQALLPIENNRTLNDVVYGWTMTAKAVCTGESGSWRIPVEITLGPKPGPRARFI